MRFMYRSRAFFLQCCNSSNSMINLCEIFFFVLRPIELRSQIPERIMQSVFQQHVVWQINRSHSYFSFQLPPPPPPPPPFFFLHAPLVFSLSFSHPVLLFSFLFLTTFSNILWSGIARRFVLKWLWCVIVVGIATHRTLLQQADGYSYFKSILGTCD